MSAATPADDAPALRTWLETREPPSPEALRSRLLPPPPVASQPPSPEGLLSLALEALDSALRGEGERRGAFRLLAADALLTYACEVTLEGDDPARTLGALLDGVLGRYFDQ